MEDKQRPLNNRGIRDAPLMAKLLKDICPEINQFYSSPAVRALSTAKYFAKEYNCLDKISIESNLYFGNEDDILDLIQNISNQELSKIIIFSHNPTITYFVNRFSNHYIENIPTCGISILESSSITWGAVSNSNTTLIQSFYPKTHL